MYCHAPIHVTRHIVTIFRCCSISLSYTHISFNYFSATQGKVKRATIPNRKRHNLKCDGNNTIRIVTATYSRKNDPACQDLDQLDIISKKCDSLPVCVCVAEDPSTDQSCTARNLVVRYQCVLSLT